eukprot:Skav234770  [mRNA]  locus=scaffold2396:235519:249716:- [translate_table: standard]
MFTDVVTASPQEDAQEDFEQEERDEYKEQVQAMTKFLRDYGGSVRRDGGTNSSCGLTWVGEEPEPSLAEDLGGTVAAQLSRPGSGAALTASEVVDVQVLSSRVSELNGLVEGARVQRSAHGGPNYARLVASDEILPLTFFQDGVKLGPCAFQFYHSRAATQLIQDIMDGYFPYELKQDYPDGVMLKVIDRVSQTYAVWKESAGRHDRDLAEGADRLAVGWPVWHHRRSPAWKINCDEAMVITDRG